MVVNPLQAIAMMARQAQLTQNINDQPGGLWNDDPRGPMFLATIRLPQDEIHKFLPFTKSRGLLFFPIYLEEIPSDSTMEALSESLADNPHHNTLRYAMMMRSMYLR